jgi:hypothetical protein
MSRLRLAFFAAVCLASLLWASQVFLGLSVRFSHQGLVETVRSGKLVTDDKRVAGAMIDYENAVNSLPCNSSLLSDLALLRAYTTDMELESSEEGGEAALNSMHAALVAQLKCSPRDGKLWLDLANIGTLREGLSDTARAAYAMSAKVAPGESWLAEKRLIFALKFQPMLDDSMRSVAQSDLAVLERAHPNRMSAVQKEAAVESSEALYAVLGVRRPPQAK